MSGAGEEPVESYELLSYRDGQVRTYDKLPSAGMPYGMRYADRDQRPDLLLGDPFEFGEGDHEMGCRCQGGFAALWHSLPDGTFTQSDAVALKDLRKQCPRHPGERAIPRDADADPFRRINCMRLWGDSIETIAGRIDKDCEGLHCDEPDYQGCCSSLDFKAHLKGLSDVLPVLAAPSSSR